MGCPDGNNTQKDYRSYGQRQTVRTFVEEKLKRKYTENKGLVCGRRFPLAEQQLIRG